MFSTEKIQTEICLLKSNLDEIDDELVVQVSRNVVCVPFIII